MRIVALYSEPDIPKIKNSNAPLSASSHEKNPYKIKLEHDFEKP